MESTECQSNDDVLKHVARSNYEVWTLARNPSSGVYIGRVDLTQADLTKQRWMEGVTGPTGLGLIAECIAHKLGWITDKQFEDRVVLTLKSLTGRTPSFRMP